MTDGNLNRRQRQHAKARKGEKTSKLIGLQFKIFLAYVTKSRRERATRGKGPEFFSIHFQKVLVPAKNLSSGHSADSLEPRQRARAKCVSMPTNLLPLHKVWRRFCFQQLEKFVQNFFSSISSSWLQLASPRPDYGSGILQLTLSFLTAKHLFPGFFTFFNAIFKFLRPEHDCYAKFTSCST